MLSTFKAPLLSLLLLTVLLGTWELFTPSVKNAENMTEYELLMGGAADQARVPPPSAIFVKAYEELSDPFMTTDQMIRA